MYNSVNYIYQVVHYIPSVILSYFVTGSLYLFSTFIQFPLPPNPISGNHKLELFVYGFVCFWSIIDPQKYVSSCYKTQRFDFSIHFKMITTTSYNLLPYKDITYLLTTLPTVYISYPWFIYFATGSFYLLTSPHLFLSFPTAAPSSDNNRFVLYIYNSVSVLLHLFIVLFFRSHM